MKEYPTFAATESNQITESYYHFLIGEINRGTTSKKASRILRQNGSHEYFTYHLVSVA